MKKFVWSVLLCSTLLSLPVQAARTECSYSPLQQVIRFARTVEDIEKRMNDGVNFKVAPRCGGNVLQLATLRGNTDIFELLLRQGNFDLDIKVSNADYPIIGAPKEIPLAFFIAHYAPNKDIMRLLMDSDVDLLGVDDKGETILWYLNKNPVLMYTDVSDELTDRLLKANPSKESRRAEKAERKTDNTENNNKARYQKSSQSNTSKQRSQYGGNTSDVVEAEPDAPYRHEENVDGLDDTVF
ncbi:MAG: hypothetical protein IJY58_06195 [Alphaproteobacteria bacterium]|nr:hypothetical protein [Alphaproteobacteria bacterium]